MAFPTVSSISSGIQGSNLTTDQPVTLPATINADDVCLVFISADGGTGITPPADTPAWTAQFSATGGSPDSYCFGRVMDGDEGGTEIIFVTVGSEQSAYVAVALGNVEGGLAGVEAGSPNRKPSGDGDQGDPVALTPSWGSDDVTWFSSCAWDNNGAQVTVTVFNEPDNQTQAQSGTNAGAGQAICSDEATASTRDPSAFTLSLAASKVSTCVAVRGASASGQIVERTLSEAITTLQDGSPIQSKHFKPGDRITSFSEQMFLFSVFGRIVQDNFSSNDQIILQQALRRLLMDSSDVQDANLIIRESIREISDNINSSDFVNRSVERHTGSTEVFVRILEDGIPLVDDSDSVLHGTNVRQLTDAISFSDLSYMSIARVLADDFPVFDGTVQSRLGRRRLSDALAATDDKRKFLAIDRVLSNDAVVTDLIRVRAQPQDYEAVLEDSISVFDNLSSQHIRPPVPSVILFGIEYQ